MSIKFVYSQIEGNLPILINRFTKEAERAVSSTTRTKRQKELTPREDATNRAYIDPETGGLYMPNTWLRAAIMYAGRFHTLKGNTKISTRDRSIVPAAINILERAIPFTKPDGELIKDFEVDSRPAVIPKTKGRIMRHRPRLDEWCAEFTIRVNEDVLSVQTVRKLVRDAGLMVGLGDFRIVCKGWFGGYDITSWIVEDA